MSDNALACSQTTLLAFARGALGIEASQNLAAKIGALGAVSVIGADISLEQSELLLTIATPSGGPLTGDSEPHAAGGREPQESRRKPPTDGSEPHAADGRDLLTADGEPQEACGAYEDLATAERALCEAFMPMGVQRVKLIATRPTRPAQIIDSAENGIDCIAGSASSAGTDCNSDSASTAGSANVYGIDGSASTAGSDGIANIYGIDNGDGAARDPKHALPAKAAREAMRASPAKTARKPKQAPPAKAARRRIPARDRVRPGDFESSMRGVTDDLEAYFAENPQTICGVPPEGPWTPISELAEHTTGRVAVHGEVVYSEGKPIKGDKRVFEFAIYDGTGSVTCKMFAPSEPSKRLEGAIKPGAFIALRGAMQYDAFIREHALFPVDIALAKARKRADGARRKRVELHMHTQMSAQDAFTPAASLVKRAAEWGWPAVAVTDHGVVQALPEAYAAGKAHGIKVILGVEGYLADSADDKDACHIILLAKNAHGLKNLYKLVSKSHIESFKKRPRMLRSDIESHREGIILGSACESGELYRAAVRGEPHERLREIAAFYDYLEIQPADNNRFLVMSGALESMDAVRRVNAGISELGEHIGKPVVAACDVHFMDPGDEAFRRILFKVQGYDDADSQPPLHMRTTEDMLEEFDYLGPQRAHEVVVENTQLVASWIEDDVRPIPEGMFAPTLDDAAGELTALVTCRAREIYGDPLPKPVTERLDRELDTIVSKNFSVMYMIAHKLVKKSNDDGYPVGSRGSVGSSLVATLAGITEVNPLPPHYVCPSCKASEFPQGSQTASGAPVESGFDLPPKPCPACGAPSMHRDGQDILFEMFLGAKGQEKAPDIDLNFSGEYQSIAHKYVEDIFGSENVFKAGTISTFAKKTAYGYVKKYAEMSGVTFGKAETERLMAGIVGVKRTTGQHPGGIVVLPKDREIFEFTPVQRPADAVDSSVVTTHFDFDSLHDTLLKLDMLGHDDPTIMRMLNELTGVPPESVDMGDPELLRLFTSVEPLGVRPEDIGARVGTFGLPEFGTRFVRQMLHEAQPRTFSDLLQISGLSHGKNVWANNAQELIRSGVCDVSEVIGTRESLVLYLMRSGLDQLSAFNAMEKVRSKKKSLSAADESQMREHSVPEWYIASCRQIEYLFPKAHAAAYVIMACRQAWYKVHEPLAFYATYFTVRADEFKAETMTLGPAALAKMAAELDALGNEASDKDKKTLSVIEVCIEMHARGIQFLPIDIYKSGARDFRIEDDAIRPPLSSLSGIGAAAADGIAEARSDGPFSTIEDLAERTKASKTVIDMLRRHGALAGMPERRQMSFL